MAKSNVKGDKRKPLSINELLNSSDKKDQVIGAYRLFVDVVPEKQRKSHQSRGSYLRDRKSQITDELVKSMESLRKASSGQRDAKAKEFIELVNKTVFAGGGGRKANLESLKDSFFK